MRYPCPGNKPDGKLCAQPTTANRARKYLPGESRAHNSSVFTVLRKRQCRKCKHEFILRTEYPLDAVIAPVTAVSYNWAEFANALAVKPGIPIGGTTYSEYTLLTGRDVADAWWKILGYEKPPVIKRAG